MRDISPHAITVGERAHTAWHAAYIAVPNRPSPLWRSTIPSARVSCLKSGKDLFGQQPYAIKIMHVQELRHQFFNSRLCIRLNLFHDLVRRTHNRAMRMETSPSV